MARLRFAVATTEHRAALEAFNQRVTAAGGLHRLSLRRPFPLIQAPHPDPIVLEKLVCFDAEGEVRGGVSIKRMPFWVNGAEREVAFPARPVSEGLTDPTFAAVGPALHREVLRRYPLAYGVGAGSLTTSWARLLRAAGWYAGAVPFFFHVCDANRVCRELRYLRHRSAVRLGLDFAAATKLASIAAGLIDFGQRLRRRHVRSNGLVTELVETWDGWADDIWDRVRNDHRLIGDRSSRTLESLYPVTDQPLTRLRFVDDGGTIQGWAVVSAADLTDHRHFGNMRLGAIVDVLAPPARAHRVLSGAIAFLESERVDLIVANHSDHRWVSAMRDAGMHQAKTNYFVFLSPALRAVLDPVDQSAPTMFLMRGDGHGPQHLW